MRNLKKILALVLALVMVVGLMATASAVTPGTGYADDADITKYDESVQILTALGIYEGDGTNFNPNTTITRAEVATLIYRVVTQDTAGKYVNIYSDYNQFADVDSSAWYAGYVNFCANGGYLKGDGTNFYPMEKVTGYQVLAILLRVIGYGMEGEYEGTNWHIRTASKAAELGITANIMSGTLGAYSTRAMVAEMIYRAIAQTSVVDYNRVSLYTKVGTTYAYQQFGLYGTGYTTYEGLTVNALAEADAKYGEPYSVWNIKGGDPIVIRYNPVATYADGVAEATLYAAAGLSAANPTVYNVAVDGFDTANVDLNGKNTKDYKDTANGVTTEVYVADGREFIVIKNTYVAYVAYAWDELDDASITLSSDMGSVTLPDPYGVTAELAKYTIVLYTQYENKLDLYSIHAAPVKAAQTVTNSYDTSITTNHEPAANASSYFLVGTTKYDYSTKYNFTFRDPILDREKLVPAKETVQDLYFDDYGHVIYTEATDLSTRNETGYVIIRHGAYGGNIADNRWVGNFTVITEDGTQTTIKGAINAEGYYTTQAAASDATAAKLGMYFYEKKNGYYALDRVDEFEETIATTLIGDTFVADNDGIDTGVANSMGTKHLIDDNTLFVIANYDASGAISGYSVVTGFKNIPVMSGELKIEYTYSTKTGVAKFVFIQGAVQTAQTVGTAVAENCFYLVDTTPEKQFNTFDRHSVIVNGTKTTLDFVKGAAPDAKGFYSVKTLKNGLVNTVEPKTTFTSISYRTAGVLLCNSSEYVTMSNGIVVYNITGSGVAQLTAAQIANLGKLSTVEGYIAAYDVYGYATVIYVLNAKV